MSKQVTLHVPTAVEAVSTLRRALRAAWAVFKIAIFVTALVLCFGALAYAVELQDGLEAQEAQTASLTKENEALKKELAATKEKLKAAEVRLSNALLPEATVGEALKVHVVNPTKRAVGAATDRVKAAYAALTQ